VAASDDLRIERGLPAHLRDQAASVFEEAFSEKLAWAISSSDRRLAFLETSIAADHAVSAIRGDELLGVAGLSSSEGVYRGGLMAGTGLSKMRQELGTVGALRAAAVLNLGEHKPAPGELYLDGLAVAESTRGQGIGTRLLDEIAVIGREGGFRWVRLEVIDTNPRAQQLYERAGYRVTKVDRFGFMRVFIGFGASITMELAL